MKTYEEINKICPYDRNEYQQGYGIWQCGFMEGEKSGAEDQKRIDIDKACKWLKSHLPITTVTMRSEIKNFKYKIITKENRNEFISHFLKAMEE